MQIFALYIAIFFNCRYFVLSQHGYSWATMLYIDKFTIRFWSTQWDAAEDGSWYVIISLFCYMPNFCFPLHNVIISTPV
jgi:hypothetical protein